MEYTDAQRAAIGTLDEPLLIVACAGSGKTQVISERIVETLNAWGTRLQQIVANTTVGNVIPFPQDALTGD